MDVNASPDDLDGYLGSLARDEALHVDEVLKESPYETTQRVSFVAANGAELGPFVRKVFPRDAGLGTAYETICAAQRSGRRFRHIPRVFDCYRTGDAFVAVMEYVPGPTLAQAVEKLPGAAARRELARTTFPLLCDAVSELHEGMPSPVVHRDLKPENVVVPCGGALVLIDFGIARSFRRGASRDTLRFGTCEYAPPEQFGFGQTDVRSDVYALGLCLWFCCTGRVPSPSDRERGYADPDVPETIRRVVEKASAFDPSARYESARDLKAAFVWASAHAASRQAGGGRAGDKHTGGNLAAAVPMRPSQAIRPAEPRASTEPPASTATSAPAAPDAPTGSTLARDAAGGRPAAGLRALAARLAGSVPEGIGHAWNTLVLLAYLFFLAVCAYAAASPTMGNARYPLWFLVFEYLVYVNAILLGLGYLLLDKRWLKRRFPLLARRTLGKDVLLVVVVLAVLTAVWLALGQIAT